MLLGRTTFKYHEADYDGIVLKLDAGFMACNPELEEAIKVFEQALKDTKFSQMMPSHTRNLSELANWKEKSEDIRKEKKEAEDRRQAMLDEHNKKLNHEVLPIEYEMCSASKMGGYNEIVLGGVDYCQDDLLTRRENITAKAKRAFGQAIESMDTVEEFIAMLKENRLFAARSLPWQDINWKAAYLTATSWGVIEVKFEIPYVQIYEHGKKDRSKTYSRRAQLMYDEKYGYLISFDVKGQKRQELTIGGSQSTYTILDGFEKHRHKFVKK